MFCRQIKSKDVIYFEIILKDYEIHVTLYKQYCLIWLSISTLCYIVILSEHFMKLLCRKKKHRELNTALIDNSSEADNRIRVF